MTTLLSSVTFETAALADVIKKAAKVAPSKGAAFDKAAGIMFEFDPAGAVPLCVVRVTNLDLFMMEWVTVTEWSGEAQRWRLPSALLALVIGGLPIGTGKTVTFTSETLPSGNILVHVSSGRTKARLFCMDSEYYPQWGAFDPDQMFPAPDLGGRIAQVEWAASGSEPDLAGVLLDGERAVATDRYKLVTVPLKIPDLAEAIIVPGSLLGQILKQTGDVQIGVDPVTNFLQVMPDDTTQIKSVVLQSRFPGISRILDQEFDTSIEVSRDALVEVMTRVNALSLGERGIPLRCYFGKEQIAVYMENPERGSIGDILETPGYAAHELLELRFTARNLIESLTKSPNDKLTLSYDCMNGKSKLKIDDGAGYQCWVMPRNPSITEDQ